MTEQRFVMIQDQDCHWYVCPEDKQDEADEYFHDVDLYWNDGDLDNVHPPDEPSYLFAVGGSPSSVTFTGWVIS